MLVSLILQRLGGHQSDGSGVIPALVDGLAGKTIGHLPKDVPNGKIPDEWKNA